MRRETRATSLTDELNERESVAAVTVEHDISFLNGEEGKCNRKSAGQWGRLCTGIVR